MKCPRCGKEAFLVYSYIRKNGTSKFIKEVFRGNKRRESVMLKQYQCPNGCGQFLYKSNSPLPDEYAFDVDRPSFKIFNINIGWATKEIWEQHEKEERDRKRRKLRRVSEK
jgi:ribosomal protein S27AE